MQTKVPLPRPPSAVKLAVPSHLSPPDPGVEHGPHAKADHHHCVCPGRPGDSLARRLCAAQPSREEWSLGRSRRPKVGPGPQSWCGSVGTMVLSQRCCCCGAPSRPGTGRAIHLRSSTEASCSRQPRRSSTVQPNSLRSSPSETGRQGDRLRKKHPKLCWGSSQSLRRALRGSLLRTPY
jgi:hypothetical protein